eukprot:GILJ01024821.1.p1 GENE.GILJ01024821.1~~GILJ01024821.1.p1  ORF type:complete len:241 (-),score=18.72 GILJ01024821.1:259-981(-)
MRRDQSNSCCFVSIGGPMRNGKSSLLNFLAGDDSAFEVHNRGPCTQGVDLISANPSAVPEDKAVFFADIEGEGDDPDATHDQRLMLTMMIVSHVFIFNFQGQIGKRAIAERLSELAAFGRQVKTVSGNTIFGHLHLVFRDWRSRLSEAEIETYLFGSPDESASTDPALERLRANIRATFSSVTVTCLPTPVDSNETLSNTSQLFLNQVSEGFRTAVDRLRSRIHCELLDFTARRLRFYKL